MLADETVLDCDDDAPIVYPKHYWGCCPICHSEPLILNVNRQHFATCPEHKTAWWIGSNLFSGWMYESPEQHEANRQLLLTEYTAVEGDCNCPVDANGESE